jgi:hypothetical protein
MVLALKLISGGRDGVEGHMWNGGRDELAPDRVLISPARLKRPRSPKPPARDIARNHQRHGEPEAISSGASDHQLHLPCSALSGLGPPGEPCVLDPWAWANHARKWLDPGRPRTTVQFPYTSSPMLQQHRLAMNLPLHTI